MAKKRSTEKHASHEGVRLHKAMADAGVGSRRACEEMIAEARVAVNGRVVTAMPVWVDPTTDEITVDGAGIGRRPTGRHTYILVHKTRGVVCTNRDPQARRTILDLVPHKQRLFCVGRLDADSTGLVLLTDDGELANQLTHPRYGVSKTYEATVKGRLTADDVEKMNRGIWLADKRGKAAKARAVSVRIVHADRQRTQIRITLREGRNREIRRILARLGYNVKRLKRSAIGALKLKGVAPGQWRELSRGEVNALRKSPTRP